MLSITPTKRYKMNKIDDRLNELIAQLDYSVVSDMFAKISSGKKLRSKLICKIAGESEKSINLCAIIELIHLASLLHDDVIDDASLRRGEASINALFGNKNAIMLGDTLYSKGFFELSKFGEQISALISDTVCKLSLGELMDVELSKAFNSDESAYFRMIYYKTAVLIEASAGAAALLANADILAHREYGKNLGIAFQIVDDILDITSDEATLGKPAMSDFKEGKTTLPYILLFKSQNESQKEQLKALFTKDLSTDELGWLKEQFSKYKIIEKSIQIATDYANKALGAVNNPELKEVVNAMINRKF